jgi:hypothetical protein
MWQDPKEDVADALLGQPDSEHLVFGVTQPESRGPGEDFEAFKKDDA